MAGGRSGRRLATALALTAVLSACGSNPKTESLEGYTAEQLYKQGELVLETGKRPQDSLRYFQEIERLYPYTEYAKRALIMQAFTLHKTKKYEESRAASQRFLDFYPDDEDAAYAQYLMALSYYDQIDDVGRDQGLTFQALQAMRDVIEKYPDSEYAQSAILKFDLAFDHLAAKEMEIGRYYLKRKHYAAALNRFRTVVQDFQTTTHTAEALHRLVECYLALGFESEAQTAAAILGYNYQSSPFYQDSFNLLKGRGLSPEAKGDSWLTKIYRQMVRGEWL
ncbi:outer membrane protein assembly factor BamD [Pseudogemmobacter blasticus]|uniref:Outer membrane protein assembly factor BamD n=1 Tax=Fuscovulum blasticum DSM 2131 TaxID=1188250 RepID=A0A2T4J5P4_FUSBL|nr:outer membrane protein assembly factor BamD [Fuscovulum blasticum]AWD20925.1 outer membrane protein assembly factor BamD [Fuscovulum blasticum]PTE13173.1 outer membrane protein assembly factor BamD [Fuscovulum blasticum DSM 2131]